MYTINGRFLCTEDGYGIANITAVLYDLDPTLKNQGEAAARPITAPGGTLFEGIPGQRLGSATTDRQGMFRISFERGAFAQGDPEQRPDLLLLALAPEETRLDENGEQVSVPAKERLLYHSSDFVLNAATEEHLLIRLPRALLSRHNLHRSGAEEATTSETSRIEAAAKRDASVLETIDKVTAARARDEAAAVLARRAVVKKAFSSFSMLRADEKRRSENTYLEPGGKLSEKQDAAIDARLEQVSRNLERGVTRKMSFTATDQQLQQLGISTPTSGDTFEMTLKGEEARSVLQQAVRFGPLDRGRTWLEIACARLRAEHELEAAIGRCSAPEATDETPPPSDGVAPAVVIGDQLAKQFAHTTPPEIELQYGKEVGGRVTATITTPSPADVTRYHDFHDLQIAFEHIWTEAVDETLPDLFQDLYGEMVRFQQRVSGVAETARVQNVDDMRRLYGEFRGLVDAVEREHEPIPGPPGRVPPTVQRAFGDITPELWSVATASEQATLRTLASTLAELNDYDAGDGFLDFFSFGGTAIEREVRKGNVRGSASRIIATLRRRLAAQRRAAPTSSVEHTRNDSTLPMSRLRTLFADIDARLGAPYRFDIFAKDSVNFGVLLTYRQQWVPLDYQVGSLVSTLPLAPKETRKYTTKRVIRKTRSEKRLEDREQSSQRERNSTSRADAEIVRQARDRTSFEQTANGTINVGVFQGQFGTRFGVEAERSSAETKKNFREAVLKAADSFKEKHTLEIESGQIDELQTESVGEISNPNDEITVTYLFYELQRQYEISERLQRLTPVVLVANEVPAPHQVDEDWLLEHQWIIERALLDESLRPALVYITNGLAGDQLALEALRESAERQIGLVEALTEQVEMKTKLAQDAFDELRNLMGLVETSEDAERMRDIGLALVLGPLGLIGMGGDDEAAEKREEIAKMALERADAASQEVSAKLTREVTAMQEAIDKYVRALQEHFDHKMAIAKLRVHVKQNILHYMQAIWDHEPSDQRYFRLYNIEIPWIAEEEFIVRVGGQRGAGGAGTTGAFAPGWNATLSVPLFEGVQGSIPLYRRTRRRLNEVADLDNLLGYKGNYMIFPAREHSFIHLYMSQDYIDPTTGGIRDPDGPGYTARELLDYICCLKKHAPDELEEKRPQLLEMIRERMTSPRPESELVVIPTDSLFIEALPGKHPVMEPFKVVHRALDVKKVQGEVRELEIENLRRAARLLEGERGDPNVEKTVNVYGRPAVDVDVD